MSEKNEFWPQEAEHELEDEYKNYKMTEIPDLWEEIERNLAPKPEKKRKKRTDIWKRMSLLAALLLVLAVLLPTFYFIGKDRGKTGAEEKALDQADGAEMDAASDSAGASSADSADKSAETVPEKQDGGMEDGNNGVENFNADQNTDQNTEQDEGRSDETSKLENSQELTFLADIEILHVTEAEGERTVTAEVVGDDSGTYADGEILTLTYEEGEVHKEELSGRIRVSLQKLGEKIKILRIIP